MRDSRPVGWWLIAICVFVALMVIVGGATRLTNSGLSITEWHPVTGVIPPLSHDAWQAEFDRYKQIPQYTALNKGMGLAGFKSIYWWEWGHRLLGRLIGMVFLLPLIWFIVTKRIPRGLVGRLVLIFVLGGLQGLLGWYMVMSGLANRIEVSQYRLAAHLGVAFLIFAATLWTALDILRAERPPAALRAGPKRLPVLAGVVSALVFCQVLLGALVAGLRAGYRYNTWPMMEGRFFPDGAFSLHPWFRNFFENQGLVQFDHRIGAYLVVTAVTAMWLWGRKRSESREMRRALDIVLAFAWVQALIGITTLILVVPLPLGLLHQSCALGLFTASIYAFHVAAMPVRGVRVVQGSDVAGSAVHG
jgi:cytochrome c oxidase assembly protein subunit 15